MCVNGVDLWLKSKYWGACLMLNFAKHLLIRVLFLSLEGGAILIDAFATCIFFILLFFLLKQNIIKMFSLSVGYPKIILQKDTTVKAVNF